MPSSARSSEGMHLWNSLSLGEDGDEVSVPTFWKCLECNVIASTSLPLRFSLTTMLTTTTCNHHGWMYDDVCRGAIFSSCALLAIFYFSSSSSSSSSSSNIIHEIGIGKRKKHDEIKLDEKLMTMKNVHYMIMKLMNWWCRNCHCMNHVLLVMLVSSSCSSSMKSRSKKKKHLRNQKKKKTMFWPWSMTCLFLLLFVTEEIIVMVNGLEALPDSHHDDGCYHSSNRLSTNLCGIVNIWIDGTYTHDTGQDEPSEPSTAQTNAKDEIVARYGDIDVWNVSQVTTMHFLFFNKKTFNGDISRWQVDNVVDMFGSKRYSSLQLFFFFIHQQKKTFFFFVSFVFRFVFCISFTLLS